MIKYAIAFGSNIGDREGYIKKAIEHISSNDSISLLEISDYYETKPVGNTNPQDDYINGVFTIETNLPPHSLLEFLLQTEKNLGRKRSIPNAARTIDLDILLDNQKSIINSKELKIPHPRMHERDFVLNPLKTIAGNWLHPILNKKIENL